MKFPYLVCLVKLLLLTLHINIKLNHEIAFTLFIDAHKSIFLDFAM